MNKNGFVLLDALLGFLIICLSVALLATIAKSLSSIQEETVHEKINTQWFYHD